MMINYILLKGVKLIIHALRLYPATMV